MWRIENPTARKKTLNFSSSGQSDVEVTQLMSGDIVLMNALELMNWEDARTQVVICDHCGIIGCQSGNWVNLRKAGDLVLMIPAFSDIEENSWSSSEYAPPRYFGKSGTPYFDRNEYQSLVDENLGFPELNRLLSLSMSEAVRLAQLEMPFEMFGEPPIVELTRDKTNLVVAASEGEHQQHLDTIERNLRLHYNDPATASIRKLNEGEETIYLFLDAAEFIDWKALAKAEGGFRLILDDVWVIEPESEFSTA